MLLFRQEREGSCEDIFLKGSERRLTKQTELTTPGSVTAWHYQNSSVPSAGRLPLQLYSGLGEELHAAGSWMTSDLAEAVSGCFAPKAGFLFALGYLHTQETFANNLLLPMPLYSLSHYFWAIPKAGIYKLLHDWDWCRGGVRGKR